MIDDGIEFNPNRSEDFIPGVPKPRAPERVGKPVKATQADVEARMDAIVRDIIARDGQQLKYRGRGR
jgi:hypothetical protein